MIYNYKDVLNSINTVVSGDDIIKIGILKAQKLKEYINLLNEDKIAWKSWDEASYSIKSTVCHIRIHRKYKCVPYTHHGIYFSDYEVYHFASRENGDNIFLNAKNNDIICTSFSDFKRDDTEVEFYNRNSPYSDYEIIDRAKSKEGSCKGEYNLINNNCEHFANWCYLGETKSEQINNKYKIFEILTGI